MKPLLARTKRGVYELPFLGEGGARILVAIDHCGRRIAELTIPSDATKAGEYTSQLRSLLDAIDPVGVRRASWQPRIIRGGS